MKSNTFSFLLQQDLICRQFSSFCLLISCCRIEALNKWRDKCSDTSYQRLLCICIAGDMKNATDQIVELMRNYREEEIRAAIVGPSTSASATPQPASSSSSSMGKMVLGSLTVTAVAAIAGFLYIRYKK